MVLMTSNKSESDVATRRKRVFLVDRHALMRKAAADWINRCASLAVCGAAGGATSAFRALQRLRPDVVVSEILRPKDLGFVRELHRRYPRLPILVFSIQDGVVYGRRARLAGAKGYVAKAAGGDTLLASIRKVLSGRCVFSRS